MKLYSRFAFFLSHNTHARVTLLSKIFNFSAHIIALSPLVTENVGCDKMLHILLATHMGEEGINGANPRGSTVV